MALGTRGQRGGRGLFPAVSEAGLAEAVATLSDYWVLEVFKADSAGDFLLGWVSRSAAAMAFEARGTEGLFHFPCLHTLSIVSFELKALALATLTSPYK